MNDGSGGRLMFEPGGRPLLGRSAEQGLIADLLERPDSGGMLLIRGAAGIGKSALVNDAVRRAGRQRQVLRATGTPAETAMEFAGLYQLLRPVMSRAASLSATRRVALNVAFGLANGPVPERYAVAMAALDLLAEVAADRPLLVTAEDIHWMDPATVAVLAFVGRRLESDPVALIATIREDFPSPAQEAAMTVIGLSPLTDPDSRELLTAVAPDLSPLTQRRILAVAAGNPLALIELPRAVAADGTADSFDDAGWLPLSSRLRETFADRIGTLPTESRTALTWLALHDSDALPELLSALSTAGVQDGLGAFAAAAEAGLVELSPPSTVRFRHPLMRSAVYELASPDGRVRGHSALAEAVGAETERGVLHRSQTAAGLDPRLADALGAVARRAASRGAVSTAITALARAAELTPSVSGKRGYLSEAAALAYDLGYQELGDSLRGQFARLADDELSRLRVEELNETADASASGGIPRITALVELARRARALGADGPAASFLRSAAYRCWAQQPGAAPAITDIIAADPLWLDEAQQAIVLGWSDPLTNATAVTTLLTGLLTAELDSVTIQWLGHAASCIGDFELADTLYTKAVTRLRAEGRLPVLARALVLQAWAQLRRGQWSAAMPLAGEGRRLAEESGQLEWQASGYTAEAMVAALRGEAAAADSLAARAEQISVPHHLAASAATSLLARATSAAGEGDYSRAWEYLARLHQEGDPACHPVQAVWALSQLAHAAVQCGQTERARTLVRRLAQRFPNASAGPAARMNILYAEALLAPEVLVDKRLREALQQDVGTWPFERSRLQLVLGSRLRRQRDRQAREYLRAARDGFDSLGASAWADRARDELRAAGVPSPASAPAAWSGLSPQELQIARMVAEGLSNREVGERLYLSPRTIATHLYRIYPKLGITSRVQLSTLILDLLASGGAAAFR